jgi:hypothetical protein
MGRPRKEKPQKTWYHMRKEPELKPENKAEIPRAEWLKGQKRREAA